MFLCILFINSFAQDSSTTTAVNPVSASTVSNQSFSPKDVYKISWAADAPITGGGIGLSFLGLHLIKTKDDLDSLQAAAKNRNDVPSFDRSNAGFYSQKQVQLQFPVYRLVYLPIQSHSRSLSWQ